MIDLMGSQEISPELASSRTARRRERMREDLLSVAARKFAERGVAAVSVAELLDEADVSRATFYQLFSNKYNVLEQIINPVLDYAIERIDALRDDPPRRALEGIIEVYRDLWCDHCEGLLLIPEIDPETFHRFEARHRALNEALLAVLSAAEREGALRNGSAHYSLKVIARTAIPLLKVYRGHPAGLTLFSDALRGLLVAEGFDAPAIETKSAGNALRGAATRYRLRDGQRKS